MKDYIKQTEMDPTLLSGYSIWIIMGLVMVLSWIIQTTLTSRFNKYSQVRTPNGMTGAQVAQKMLNDNGIYDVKIVSIPGQLTDHYNPVNKTVNLSEGVYSRASIAAAAIAAHECGHVLQHATGYAPLKMRSALVPVVSFSNNIVMWVIMAGLFVISVFPGIFWAGVGLFAMSTLFSLVTLPVELNASHRAVSWLRSSGVADAATLPLATDALEWAAYTYVIAALGSLATLMYYISLGRGRD